MGDVDSEVTQMHAALCEGIEKIDPGAMLTRWVIIAEVIDGMGERACWTLAAPDNKKWDTIGLVAYAHRCEVGGEE